MLALSLRVESSGESIGVCFVKRVSNWDTSSALACNQTWQKKIIRWCVQIKSLGTSTYQTWLKGGLHSPACYIVPVNRLEKRMHPYRFSISYSAAKSYIYLSLLKYNKMENEWNRIRKFRQVIWVECWKKKRRSFLLSTACGSNRERRVSNKEVNWVCL